MTMANRCGLVSPFWVRLGWIRWVGASERDPLWMIEYRRCPRDGEHVERDGRIGFLCEEHAREPFTVAGAKKASA